MTDSWTPPPLVVDATPAKTVLKPRKVFKITPGFTFDDFLRVFKSHGRPMNPPNGQFRCLCGGDSYYSKLDSRGEIVLACPQCRTVGLAVLASAES